MKEQITFAIFILLLNGKSYTSKKLSEKFEVSTKTIYRCIASLCQAGLPIYSEHGRNGGFKLENANQINCQYFTLEELSSFFSFLKSNCNKYLPYDCNIDKRINSLENLSKNDIKIKSQQVIIDTDLWGLSNANDMNAKSIKNAISSCIKLKITYKTAKITEKRIIHPYSLVFKNNIWYTYAFCEKRQNFRLFKLSKISEIETLNEVYIRQNIDCLLKPWNKDFENNFDKIDLLFEVENEIANEIFDWFGSDTKIIKHNEQKSTCQATVNYCKGLIHKLIELDDKIKIISPKCVIDDLFNEFNKILKVYSANL